MHDVIIIGAGPAGLACAIAAKKRNLTCLVLEKGAVADAIRRFPTGMTFFSTSDLLAIGDVPFISSGFRPTRVEAVRYYAHVARALSLPIQPYATVSSLAKADGGFTVKGLDGRSWSARTVVVATGYFDTPHQFTVPGAGLPKVKRAYDEPYAYVGKKVAFVGGKNSVVDAALEMYREGVDVTIIHRGSDLSPGVKYWMLPDIQNRLKAGQVTGLFETTVREITPSSLILEGRHAGEIPNDVLFVMIGYTIDSSLLTEAGVEVDRAGMIPRHDERTYETNVEGLFVAGSIAAGNMNNKIFIENGRLHGEAIMERVQERISRLEKK